MNTRNLPPCPHCWTFHPSSVADMSTHLRFRCPVIRPKVREEECTPNTRHAHITL